jgi:ATP-dependent Clp protease ATP-binding subunit ClpC
MIHFTRFTDRITDGLKNVFEYSNRQAGKIGEDIYGTEVLLYGIVEEGNSYAAESLINFSLIPEWLRRKTLRMQKDSFIRFEIAENMNVYPNEDIGYALEIADEYREHFSDKFITIDHVFLALLKNPDPFLLEIFKGCNIDIVALKRHFVRKLALENEAVASYFMNNPEDSIIPPLFSSDGKYTVIEEDIEVLDDSLKENAEYEDEEVFYNNDDEEDESARSIIAGLFVSKKDKAEKEAEKEAKKIFKNTFKNKFDKDYLLTESEIFNAKVNAIDSTLSEVEYRNAYDQLVSDSISDSISASLEKSRDEYFEAYMKKGLEEAEAEQDAREARDGEGYEPSPTNKLEKYSTNLSAMGRNGKLDPVLGRIEEIENLMQILVRRRKNNAILIGEPGVGKTAVVEGLALRILEGQTSTALQNKEIITLEISSVLAGTKYRGEFEERLNDIINEVKADPNIILFIDEIHTLIGAGSAEGSNDASQLLKPALARGDFQCIGATTTDEYTKYFKKDAALERRFQIVKVPEPSINDSILILNGIRRYYEEYHGVEIADDAIVAAVNLSSQFIADRFLPDKAIDLIDEACANLKVFTLKKNKEIDNLSDELKIIEIHKENALAQHDYEKAEILHKYQVKKKTFLNAVIELGKKNNTYNEVCVEPEDIAKIVSIWSGVPVNKVSTFESESLLNLEETLHTRVIGQNMAVNAIAKAIRRSRVGLKNPTRPIGSFIFAGPTGVGKTELAKALAFFIFGSENAMVRLDMSEYMERFNLSKLIGSPPGYVGYNEGGLLTEEVKKKPYTIVLFDEIEKAHFDIFNILLQILEDGRLTDSQSRLVDFKNTLIILTSNIGAKAIQKIQKESGPRIYIKLKDDEIDPVYEKMCLAVREELKEKFRPEFLNRLDDIIIFEPLTEYNIAEIAIIMIDKLSRRTEQKMGLYLEIEKEVTDKLVKEGFDPTYGARPLRRAITNLFEDELANVFLNKNYPKGTILSVKLDDNKKIIFEHIGHHDIKDLKIIDIIRNTVLNELSNPDDPNNIEKINNYDKFMVKK